MIGSLKDNNLSHLWTLKCFIRIDDYLQTFKEFKAVQHSLNLFKELEDFSRTDQEGDAFSLNQNTLNKNS